MFIACSLPATCGRSPARGDEPGCRRRFVANIGRSLANLSANRKENHGAAERLTVVENSNQIKAKRHACRKFTLFK
jgi:hypothetical protein